LPQVLYAAVLARDVVAAIGVRRSAARSGFPAGFPAGDHRAAGRPRAHGTRGASLEDRCRAETGVLLLPYTGRRGPSGAAEPGRACRMVVML